MSFDWKALLGGIAPTLASALGGPAGIAVKAVAALSGALLGHDKGTPEELAAALAGATPEQLAALKKADQDFTLALLDRANAADQIEATDRASARAMQVSQRSSTPTVLSYAALAMFAAIFVLLALKAIPTANADTLKEMAEALKLILMTVFGFWLGGSFGSDQKTAILGRIVEKR